MGRKPTQPKTRPVVLRALAVLGLTDSEIARLLGHTPATIADWNFARRPIPPLTHGALWYVVARYADPDPKHRPDAPRGVGLARLEGKPEAQDIQDVLAEAARHALMDKPVEVAFPAIGKLGEQIIARLEAKAAAELQQNQREVRLLRRDAK